MVETPDITQEQIARLKLSSYGGGVVLSSEVREGHEWVTVRFFRRGLVIDVSKKRLRKTK